MLDIKLIREQPDLVRTKLTQTGVDPAEVERVLEADARRRKCSMSWMTSARGRARESKELGKASPEEREKKRAEMRQLGEEISAGEQRADRPRRGMRTPPADAAQSAARLGARRQG